MRGGGGSAEEQPGATFGQAGLGPRGSLAQDNQACSFLGTVDWHATDRLTAPLGVNYTNDEKSVSSQGLEVDATGNATGNLVLTFAGTFQDPVYDSFTASATGDISGATPSEIPETATPTSATCSFDVKNPPPSFGPTGSKKARLATSMQLAPALQVPTTTPCSDTRRKSVPSTPRPVLRPRTDWV